MKETRVQGIAAMYVQQHWRKTQINAGHKNNERPRLDSALGIEAGQAPVQYMQEQRSSKTYEKKKDPSPRMAHVATNAGSGQ